MSLLLPFPYWGWLWPTSCPLKYLTTDLNWIYNIYCLISIHPSSAKCPKFSLLIDQNAFDLITKFGWNYHCPFHRFHHLPERTGNKRQKPSINHKMNVHEWWTIHYSSWAFHIKDMLGSHKPHPYEWDSLSTHYGSDYPELDCTLLGMPRRWCLDMMYCRCWYRVQACRQLCFDLAIVWTTIVSVVIKSYYKPIDLYCTLNARFGFFWIAFLHAWLVVTGEGTLMLIPPFGTIKGSIAGIIGTAGILSCWRPSGDLNVWII